MPWKNFLQKLKKQEHCKRRQVDIKPYQSDSNCFYIYIYIYKRDLTMKIKFI